MIVTIKDLGRDCPQTHIEKHGWFPARPLNWECRSFSQKIKEAWLVFTGKADPFIWPEDELNKENKNGKN